MIGPRRDAAECRPSALCDMNGGLVAPGGVAPGRQRDAQVVVGLRRAGLEDAEDPAPIELQVPEGAGHAAVGVQQRTAVPAAHQVVADRDRAARRDQVAVLPVHLEVADAVELRHRLRAAVPGVELDAAFFHGEDLGRLPGGIDGIAGVDLHLVPHLLVLAAEGQDLRLAEARVVVVDGGAGEGGVVASGEGHAIAVGVQGQFDPAEVEGHAGEVAEAEPLRQLVDARCHRHGFRSAHESRRNVLLETLGVRGIADRGGAGGDREGGEDGDEDRAWVHGLSGRRWWRTWVCTAMHGPSTIYRSGW